MKNLIGLIPILEGQYYVYMLISPVDGSVFYIGKGKGRRVFAHVEEAKREPFKSEKTKKIRSLIDNNLSVIERVVFFGDERSCLEKEMELISEYGLDSLTNIRPGYIPTSTKLAVKSIYDLINLMITIPFGGCFQNIHAEKFCSDFWGHECDEAIDAIMVENRGLYVECLNKTLDGDARGSYCEVDNVCS